jgi:hypothetical protein
VSVEGGEWGGDVTLVGAGRACGAGDADEDGAGAGFEVETVCSSSSGVLGPKSRGEKNVVEEVFGSFDVDMVVFVDMKLMLTRILSESALWAGCERCFNTLIMQYMGVPTVYAVFGPNRGSGRGGVVNYEYACLETNCTWRRAR